MRQVRVCWAEPGSRFTLLFESYASEAVDKTHKQEHKQLSEAGDDRLSKTKSLWLTSQENLSEKQRQRFEEVFTLQLKTAKAWGLKELLRQLWEQATIEDARKFSGRGIGT